VRGVNKPTGSTLLEVCHPFAQLQIQFTECFGVAHNFSHNTRPNLAQYKVNGQPTSPRLRRPRKVGRPNKQTKGKSKMKRLNITFGTILLVLGCFAFSPAAKADPPIAGLWHEYYTSDFGPPFETYAQWHSDGLEIEDMGTIHATRLSVDQYSPDATK
jgi:hypothetical protein